MKNEESSSLSNSMRAAPPTLRRSAIYLIGGCVVIIVGLSIYRHWSVSSEAAERDADLKAGPHVRVAVSTKSKPERSLSLVGEAKPFASVTLYAKVSGYLREVKVDKGDHVKKGQVLAIIESPETNRAYEGAQADAKNKATIARRMMELKEKNLVSPQEVDQATSDSDISASKLASLGVEKDYETLRAPFDGMITARFADPGALMQNAASSQTSSLPVVSVAQVDELRVYTYIDQRDASFVKAGQPVTIHLAERPRLELQAKVTRVTGELDEQTKMLLTEIDVDNKNSDLVAGSFVQVRLSVPTESLVQVPVEAIAMRVDKGNKGEEGEHSFVPVINADNTVAWHEVRIADTDGKNTRILSGLEDGQQIALNLNANIEEGSHVRPLQTEAPKADKTPASSPHPAQNDPVKTTEKSTVNERAANAPRDPSSQNHESTSKD